MQSQPGREPTEHRIKHDRKDDAPDDDGKEWFEQEHSPIDENRKAAGFYHPIDGYRVGRVLFFNHGCRPFVSERDPSCPVPPASRLSSVVFRDMPATASLRPSPRSRSRTDPCAPTMRSLIPSM